MKKRIQFVALLLALTLSAQPVFADNACGHRTCGNHPAMDCCPHPNSTAMTMPMGMSCDQSRPVATAPMHCTGHACCMISPATVPAITASNLSTPISASITILPATPWTPVALSATRPPPGPRPILPTARYILFRDFRI